MFLNRCSGVEKGKKGRAGGRGGRERGGDGGVVETILMKGERPGINQVKGV